MNYETSLIQINKHILIKLEMNNISGSHKYRAARYIVENAINTGDIDHTTTVIEKTGGNFGFGLLAACLERNIPVELAIGLSFSKEKKSKLKSLGAILIGKEMLSEGKTPREVVEWHLENQKILGKKYYYTNQFFNIGSYLAHLETGNEIAKQLKKFYSRVTKVIFIGCAGTGASFAGVSDSLEKNGYLIKRVLVEPKGCDSKNNIFNDHSMEGMSVGVKPPFLNWDNIDEYQYVEDKDLNLIKKEAYKDTGFLIGNTSAACYKIAKSYHQYCSEECIVLTFFYDSGIWYQ